MKILLADDHALFREGLKHILRGLDESCEIIEADSYIQAVEILDSGHVVDLALVDLSMPGLDGFAGLTAVCEKSGKAPVVVVSAMEGGDEIRQAMDCGASGYIPKTLDSAVVVSALQLVFSGGIYLPPNLLGSEPAEPLSLNRTGDGQGGDGQGGGEKSRLTPRQHDVLQLVAQGFSNKEIAGRLELAEGTVKLHVTAMLKALDVNNRTQAAIKAASMGMTPAI